MFNIFKSKKNSKIIKSNKAINHSLLKSNTPLSLDKNKKLNLTGLPLPSVYSCAEKTSFSAKEKSLSSLPSEVEKTSFFKKKAKEKTLPVGLASFRVGQRQALLVNSNKTEIELYEKFINLLMIHGKKIKAYNILYDSLTFLEAKNLRFVKSNQLEFVLLDPFQTKFERAVSRGNAKDQGISNNQFSKDISTFNFLFNAIKNIKPSVEVRKVRKGGRIYQVPSLIPKKRQEALAIRWIIDAAKIRKKNSKISFAECLAIEFIEASKNQGKPRQKRDELHKLAELNRAYIRFRWW